MVSPLKRDGRPISRAANVDGAALSKAMTRKRRRYAELVNSPYGQLVVLACETGGRWNEDALKFVARLAKFKAASAPSILRAASRAAWQNRWWGLLSVAAQSALATTLLGEGVLALAAPAGHDEVPLGDVFDCAHMAPLESRLPLRQH